MTRRILRTLAAHGQYRAFAAGEPVVRAGDAADAFYVILRGRAGVAGAGAAATLREGDYFGEIGLVGDGTRSVTVIAVDDLLTLEVPRDAFVEVLSREPDLARTVMSGLASRLQTAEQRPRERARAEDAVAWPLPGLA